MWGNAGSTGTAAGGSTNAAEKPFSLWWYFAVALLGVAVVESIFADLWREHRLLPGGTGPTPNDEAISVRVVDSRGTAVFVRGTGGASV